MQAEEVEDQVEDFFESAVDQAGNVITKDVGDEQNVQVEKKIQWYIWDFPIRDEQDTNNSVISKCFCKIVLINIHSFLIDYQVLLVKSLLHLTGNLICTTKLTYILHLTRKKKEKVKNIYISPATTYFLSSSLLFSKHLFSTRQEEEKKIMVSFLQF